ncbi:MAG: bifunctional 23S rRNA (guanine(2069)-N(7))-methyltransferase RlmK/23S rRNA (guanine(2445)-N(2))-methyltransferase RlmL [Gammaproteobacteria bacterium]
MKSSQRFFATAPKGVSGLLADELRAFGATDVREVAAGALFNGTLEVGYRACLWSRTASRILLQVVSVPVSNIDELYSGVKSIAWSDHLPPEGTLAVDVNLRGSTITHSQFAAQRVKDAIVDQFRDRLGVRPSVDLRQPDLRINVSIDHQTASIAIDLSGESLHRRGYRSDSVVAPLKQNLAAAILIRASWPDIAKAGGGFVDPMCGSGTLLVEAAWMAGDIAPSLQRSRFGFERWLGHVPQLWRRLHEEAIQRAAEGRQRIPAMRGFDADLRSVRAARENIEVAALAQYIRVDKLELGGVPAPEQPHGLLAVNPPYGERLAAGEAEALQSTYKQLGETLRKNFLGWEAAVLTGNPPLGKLIGIKARRVHTLYNGAIECRLLRFTIAPEFFEKTSEERAAAAAERPLSEGAQMFANRLRKNVQALKRWVEKENISCYRLYDADMPEYAAAIDLYFSERLYVVVQEYAAPKSIDERKARERLHDLLRAIPPTLGVDREQVILKRRQRQRGSAQYEKLNESGEFHEVQEGKCRFLVNFTDYLDTGLFLDHRTTRTMVGEQAHGRDMLNLFCYTATASVHAALGGARSTTSVDLSRTYLDWARQNFALNKLDVINNSLVQADCLQWLNEQSARKDARRYGLIFLDPPTFSNSKRMEANFDVQRDHLDVIEKAMRLLVADGELIFSTNRQRFNLDASIAKHFIVEDISAQTLPRDFARNPRIHRCWRLRRGSN